MTEAVPAEQAAAAEKKRPLLRRLPTSLIVTLLGIALTAWLLPAFTRQWDDRQKVRELHAQFADQIAATTAKALSRGALVARRPISVSARRDQLAPVETDWDIARARVQLKLAA